MKGHESFSDVTPMLTVDVMLTMPKADAPLDSVSGSLKVVVAMPLVLVVAVREPIRVPVS